MPELRPVGIAGVGRCMPEGVITNNDLEKMVDTSDEWIVQRTGIRERRVVLDGQSTSDIAVVAAHQALDEAGVAAEDVDLIIVCTVSPDNLLPATACKVADRLGASRAGAFDIASACAGFTYGLTVAAQMVRTGINHNVLVIGAESLSRMLNYQDRNSCIIFGDGAGAVLVRPLEECEGRGELLNFETGCDGSGYEYIWRPAGGCNRRISHEDLEQNRNLMVVKGREVYRFAVNIMTGLIRRALEPYGHDQLGLIVPHQVNQRIIDSSLERLEIAPEKCMVNIDRYGNTSSASVPMALSEAKEGGRLEEGKIVVLVAFGAGLSWACVTARW